jgi:hypothetical protein
MSVDDLSSDQLLLLAKVKAAEEAFKASFQDAKKASEVSGGATTKSTAVRPATAESVSAGGGSARTPATLTRKSTTSVSLGDVKAFLKGHGEGERTSMRNLFDLMVKHFSLTCKTRGQFRKIFRRTFGAVIRDCEMERWVTDPVCLFPVCSQTFLTYDEYAEFFAKMKNAKETEASHKVEENVGPASAEPTEPKLKWAVKVTRKKAKKSNATKPKAKKSNATKPKAKKSNATKPKATKPKATKPKAEEVGPAPAVPTESKLTGWTTMAMKPKVVKPKVVKTWWCKLLVVKPKVVKPKVVKPKAGKPNAKKPNAKKPRVTRSNVSQATREQYRRDQAEKAKAEADTKAKAKTDEDRIPVGFSGGSKGPTRKERVADADAKAEAERERALAQTRKIVQETNEWSSVSDPLKIVRKALEKIRDDTLKIVRNGEYNQRVKTQVASFKDRGRKLTADVDTASFTDVLDSITENFCKISQIEEDMKASAVWIDEDMKASAVCMIGIREHAKNYPGFNEAMVEIRKFAPIVHEQLMTTVMKPFPTRKDLVPFFDASPFAEKDVKKAQEKFFAAELGPLSLRRLVLEWWNRCRECWDDSKEIHGTGKYGFSYQTLRGHLSKKEKGDVKTENKERKDRVMLWRNEQTQQRQQNWKLKKQKKQQKWEKKKK